MTDEKIQKKISHLKSLREKHRDLDKRIEVMYIERVNEDIIHRQKREKLHLKEEIENLEQELQQIEH
jgi:hypothetical protein